MLLGSLQQRQSAQYVRTRKHKRIGNRTVHVALGSQMYYTVNVIHSEYTPHIVQIDNISPDKVIVRRILHIFEILQIAGIRKFVKIHNSVLRIFIHKKADHVIADESGTSRNQYISFTHHRLYYKSAIHTDSENRRYRFPPLPLSGIYHNHF